MSMKKIISKILKIILHKKIYNNRRNYSLFIFYSNFEFFIKTLKLRIKNKKHFFLPSRHIGAIYLLNKLTKIFNKGGIKFFLWDASLLGAARNQKAIAGSAGDIDIAMIFSKKKNLKFILSLKKIFKIRILNNYNSIQLFHKFGLIDISLFQQKGTHFQLSVLDVAKDKGPVDKNKFSITILKSLTARKFDKSLTKKIIYHKKKFLPFKKKKLYSKKYLVPNNYLSIIKKTYGSKWKTPDKKEQVYFT
jgi:hypothetical protein